MRVQSIPRFEKKKCKWTHEGCRLVLQKSYDKVGKLSQSVDSARCIERNETRPKLLDGNAIDRFFFTCSGLCTIVRSLFP